LIKTLFALHSSIALDCWLAGAEEDWRHQMRGYNTREDHNPLDAVPLPLLLEWADGDPDTRYPRLAGIVPAFKNADDATEWGEGALALLGAGPDRAAVLRGLATQLPASGWIGSLADILERRRSLIQAFLDDDPAVRQVARETDDRLQREISVERSHEVGRDERFE